MKFTGENVLAAPVEQAWDALLDPAVLVRTIPGCERLEALDPAVSGDNAYAMTVTAGVASIKGTYAGSCVLTDLVEHESLVMKLDGAGAPGPGRRSPTRRRPPARRPAPCTGFRSR